MKAAKEEAIDIEVDLDEALNLVQKNLSKFVWLGRDTSFELHEILKTSPENVISLDPEEILGMEPEEKKKLEGHILVCYHGNTSKALANILKKSGGTNTYSLKGGITAITGEF
ncbi:MAG: rhodanese-like domain-containing protein [Candidatus Micrarchaeaceae archaeon]